MRILSRSRTISLLLALAMAVEIFSPAMVFAAGTAPKENGEGIARTLEALTRNTEALNRATESLDKTARSIEALGNAILEAVHSGGLAGRPPVSGLPAASSPDAPGIEIDATVPQTVKEMLAKAKWETNTDGKSFGSPEAKKGGTLKYGTSSFPPTLRCFGKNANTAFNFMLEGLSYETLLGLDYTTFKYAPGLADKWAIADDKVTFFFHIDPNAKWSDGKPVVAEDIVATWDMMTDPDIEDPFTNDYWSKYERPVALGKNIVMVKSKQLNWRAFLSIGVSFFVYPAHVLKGLGGKGFLEKYQFDMLPGSGPYTYESHKINEEIILRRRDDWWQKDYPGNRGTNNFDRLHFIFIDDENLMKEMFKKGDLDFLHVLVAREWHQEFIPGRMPQLAKGWIQKRKIFTQKPTGVSGIAFNLRKAPFDDIRVRQAFAHLYNREKMMDKLFFNEYEYIDSYFPNSVYSCPENQKIRFNPDKAVELLEEAGWKQSSRDAEGWLTKDGVRFEVSMNYIQKSSERIMTVFQEDLRDVGIKLNLKQVTWATDIKEIGERQFELSSRAYTGITFPNPENALHSKFADVFHTNNIFGFKNKRIDELCDLYPSLFDAKERIEVTREVDKIVFGEYLFAYGWYSAHTRLLIWDKFGMPPFILGQVGDERTTVSYWWFDEEKERRLNDAIRDDVSLPVGEEIVKWWDENYPTQSMQLPSGK